MKLTVFTTVFGNTDPLHEPRHKGRARFVCFTDQNIKSRTWEIVRMPSQDRPTRTSRLMKVLSHLTVNTEWSLWMDANFTLLVDPVFLQRRGEFVNFRHPWRSRITDEADEIVRLGKAKQDAIARQLATYHAEGFDTNKAPMRALSCNGVILRRHTPSVIAFNEAWADEISRHTLRDQMSVDYIAWKMGRQLSRWPGSHVQNPYFRLTHYKRPTNDF